MHHEDWLQFYEWMNFDYDRLINAEEKCVFFSQQPFYLFISWDSTHFIKLVFCWFNIFCYLIDCCVLFTSFFGYNMMAFIFISWRQNGCAIAILSTSGKSLLNFTRCDVGYGYIDQNEVQRTLTSNNDHVSICDRLSVTRAHEASSWQRMRPSLHSPYITATTSKFCIETLNKAEVSKTSWWLKYKESISTFLSNNTSYSCFLTLAGKFHCLA